LLTARSRAVFGPHNCPVRRPQRPQEIRQPLKEATADVPTDRGL
jgi:hypothetical protein